MPAAQTTLLVVDDEEVNRDLLRRRLERRGYEVIVASHGLEALAMLGARPIDLVLLDIKMPGMSGLEVLARLRARWSPTELPVIMATALTDTAHTVRSLEGGANDYVTKPLDFPVVVARIEAHLRARPAGRRRPEDQATADDAGFAGESPATPRPRPVEPAALVGHVLAGKYRIDGLIGCGSFGDVYRAYHTGLRRPVALKILRLSLGSTARDLARFQREAASACRVRHPNAVEIFDVELTDSGLPFLVMELLVGETLQVELNRVGRLPVERAGRILLPVADLLVEAHRAGIIHRDLKPSNLFLHRTARGEAVKVVDFGLAKMLSDARDADLCDLTLHGQVPGTAAYLAPERWAYEPYDGKADVYSLAVVLQQVLTGAMPMPVSRDYASLARSHMYEPPIRLRAQDPTLPEALEDLLLRTLCKEAPRRPDAHAFGRALAAACDLEAELAHCPNLRHPQPR